MNYLKKIFFPIIIAILPLFTVAKPIDGTQQPPPIIFEKSDLIIKKKDGTQIKFYIEIASTAIEREQGLMFRKEMPKITVISIDEMLDGVRLNIPITDQILKSAERKSKDSVIKTLFDEL